MIDRNKYLKKLNNFDAKFYDIKAFCNDQGVDINKLPFSIRILLEASLRSYDDRLVTEEQLLRLVNWNNSYSNMEIPFLPSRIILQDFTGVPAVVDLAAMRAEVKRARKDPKIINPLVHVDLVIDHSVMMDYSGTIDSYEKNIELEFKRNKERYRFLKWAQNSFDNFNVIPPAQGIIHQVNLEKLAVLTFNNNGICYPDTLVGTDSHTTMINGLGVLGWGVGGIEAEAAMLGQPYYMINPEVIGVKLTGELQDGVTATDLALKIVNLLRKYKVVGKIVEFFGDGAKKMDVTDRATISNMAPEYGATAGYFAVDEESIKYLKLTGRNENLINLTKEYYKQNSMFNENSIIPIYTDVLELDLSTVIPSIAGPKRPQDLISLHEVKEKFNLLDLKKRNKFKVGDNLKEDYKIQNGDIVLTSITSCTNTSNPKVMIGAGLIAKKAYELGLKVPKFVKTTLAPGSRIVTKYLKKSGLLPYLEKMGFYVAGYGCATCIGNSGPLNKGVSEAIKSEDLTVCSVISGNRNFEGRVHPDIKANYLASPILVIAYAIAGRIDIDFENEPIGISNNNKEIYLNDIFPTNKEINSVVNTYLKSDLYMNNNEIIIDEWLKINAEKNDTYNFEKDSTYVREPDFFMNIHKKLNSKLNESLRINSAKCIAYLGDSITTDHISPAGSISPISPAAKYLNSYGIKKEDFNSYGSRRGNHEVMMRGTFANIRIRNKLADGKEGGYTKFNDKIMSIYDAAVNYKNSNTDLIVIAGKEYGTGSSRDWAAKGTYMLGIKCVIAESFERIHRSNLVGMGVLPLEFINNQTRETLGLTGEETFSFNIDNFQPNQIIDVKVDGNNNLKSFKVKSRLDNSIDIYYYKNNGILQAVLSEMLKK